MGVEMRSEPCNPLSSTFSQSSDAPPPVLSGHMVPQHANSAPCTIVCDDTYSIKSQCQHQPARPHHVIATGNVLLKLGPHLLMAMDSASCMPYNDPLWPPNTL